MRPCLPDRTRQSRTRQSRNREQGSAYIITLLVLAILSIVGLSLALIGQTEIQIGANEMTANKVFYPADAGIGVSVARVMFRPPDFRSFSFRIEDEPDPDRAFSLGSVVEVSPIVPVLSVTCHLCGVTQGSNFKKIDHVLSASATRRGWTGTNPTANDRPLGRKTISSAIQIQPWLMASPGSLNFSQEDLDKVKM